MIGNSDDNNNWKTNMGTDKLHKGKHEVERFLHGGIEKPKKNETQKIDIQAESPKSLSWNIFDTINCIGKGFR